MDKPNLPPLALTAPQPIQLLDHGYVRWIETWGSDEQIIESARMSTDKGFLGWEPGFCPACVAVHGHIDPECKACNGKGEHPGDARLLRYLWNNKHSTPFEFAGLTIEVQAPIMVFREWHRHRTQSYAERSARYTPLADVNYTPSMDRIMRGAAKAQSQKNRQSASIGGVELTLDAAFVWQHHLAVAYEAAEFAYQFGLNAGVPKELARLSVPVGRYSTMRATTDLRNWLGFCALRLGAGAQEEIVVYAEAVHGLLKRSFPRTVALFDEGMAPK